MACPNVNSSQWKDLVAKIGTFDAMKEFIKNGGEIPDASLYAETFKGVNATLKIVNALQKIPRTSYPSSSIQGFYNDLIKQGAPKNQIELLKEHITQNNITDINTNDLITSLLAEMSYTIEINVAMKQPFKTSTFRQEAAPEGGGEVFNLRDVFSLEEVLSLSSVPDGPEVPSQYYSNLTVPGGTNYTENEIRIPNITPSIKGHAQFSTENGIGWFRSDEQAGEKIGDRKQKDDEFGEGLYSVSDYKDINSKTRRILEVQSDLFQKGRDKENLVNTQQDKNEVFDPKKAKQQIDSSENKFLQLLNKDNNWVTFFVKSIIQDSAKKGYEKVLFPVGDTAAKVEGHETVEQFIKNKQAQLNNNSNKLNELQREYEEGKVIDSERNHYFKQKSYVDNESDKYTVIKSVGPNTQKPSTKEDFEEVHQENIEPLILENEQLEKEIEDAKAGKLKISSIAKFYEETVANILRKQGYSPNRIKDEYGNEWNEITLSPEIAQATILFQAPGTESSEASTKTLALVNKFLERIGVTKANLPQYGLGGKKIDANGQANLLNDVIRVAEGKEGVALTEEAMHFAVAIIKQTNPQLFKQMMNKIGTFNYYKKIFNEYSKRYVNKDGTPDILKIKEEAIGKILAEYLIIDTEGASEKPELLAQTLSWWDQIKNFFLALIGKAGFNPFQEAVKEIDKIEDTKALDAPYKELADKLVEKELPGIFGIVAKNAYKEGKYRRLITLFSEQLEDPGTYQTIVDSYLQGDEELAKELLKSAEPFLQTAPVTETIFDKINKKIEDFQLKKHLDPSDTGEENNNSYYTVTIDGKQVKTDRTTAWADRENIKRNGGKDYFANPTPDQEKKWAKKAMSGTNGHLALEAIIKHNLLPDGTLKPKDEWRAPDTNLVAHPIYVEMVRFLLGYRVPVTGEIKPGFLDQFPVGAKFGMEKMLYNEKGMTKVLNKKTGKMEELVGRASTTDLLVVMPDDSIKIYDWKFMGFLLQKPDQAFLKRNQHALQLGDYKTTLRNSYGVKKVEAYTVPIHAEYIETASDAKLVGVTFGNTNFRNETHTSLLPTIPVGQSSGNEHIDRLVSALNAHYKKLYSKRVSPDKQYLKDAELGQLSRAIRNIQIAYNFDPIAAEAQTFQNSIREKLDEYKNIDWKALPKEEHLAKLEELEGLFRSATTFTNIDEVFNDVYGGEELSDSNKRIANVLATTSSAAKRVLKEIQNIQAEYVSVLAKEKNIDNISLPTKEVKGVINMFTEGGSVNLPAENLAVKLSEQIKAKAKQNLAHKLEKEFTPKYLALVTLAGERDPFSLIGEGNELIKETKKELWDSYREAKENQDKSFIKSIVDTEILNKLIEETINKHQERIMKTVYSTDPEANAKLREQHIKDIHSTFNIYADKFNGFNHWEFDSIVKKAIIRKPWWTDQYKALHNKGNEAALDMHSFLTDLNKEAFDLGILGKGHKMSFFAFVTGTILERLNQADSVTGTTLQLFKDIGQVDPADSTFGDRDDETGELKRTIPKLFTHTNKDTKDLSKDLIKVVPLWMRFIEDYRAATELEYELITLEQYEEAKGHLEVEGNKVVFEADKPKVFPGNVVNTNRIKSVSDWNVYGIRDKNNTVFDNLVGKVVEGTEEEQAKKVISAKKVLDNANKMTQVIAVGAKLSVAIPNAAGVFMQSIANSGLYYTGWEYMKNSGRVATSQLSTIEKGLINLVVPLNDDVVKEAQRKIGKKTSLKKYLETWTMQEILMESNRWPDKQHQITSAVSFFQNSMVVEGKIVNMRQYLQSQPEFKNRYKKVSSGEEQSEYIKKQEAELEKKIQELQKTQSLTKIAKFNDKGELEIPGLDLEGNELSEYKTKISDFGRKLTGQMSQENVSDSRKDILVRSFMMFKNWIPKQIAGRTLDIKKNINSEQWEYGRTRLFVKTIFTLGFRNITKIRDIMTATPEGIRIMDEMLEKKREAYYKKTGLPLTISDEEFYDMVRKELKAEWKELQILFYVVAMVVMVKAAAPPEDETLANKNRYKFWGKLAKKVSDEMAFYYNPASADSITRGTILPALGLLTRAEKFLEAFSKETVGYVQGDEEKQEDAHPLKYFMNIFPVTSTFQNELFPLMFPEAAKEHGIITTAEPRIAR